MSIFQLVSEKVFYSLVWSIIIMIMKIINQWWFDCLIKTIAREINIFLTREINLSAPFFNINAMPISHVHWIMVVKVRSLVENLWGCGNRGGNQGGKEKKKHGAACIAFHCSNICYILEQWKAIHAAPWEEGFHKGKSFNGAIWYAWFATSSLLIRATHVIIQSMRPFVDSIWNNTTIGTFISGDSGYQQTKTCIGDEFVAVEFSDL